MPSSNSSPEQQETSGHKKLLVKCVFCKSKNFTKWGKRKTENRGFIQTYKCKSCGRRFCNDEGFYRMRNSEAKITSAIDLYFSNLSSRKVRNYFGRHLEHNASHVSILDWCRKYVLRVHKFVNALQPVLGGRYYADETEIDCSGRNDLFWACVDWDTRFIVDTHYSLNSDIGEAEEFLIKLKAKGKPHYIQTDSAGFYPKAIRHKYNVRIETVFSKIKDRVHNFRGLKALWSAPILMQGIILQHNLIEAHTTTGKVPCELAGLKLETGQNRWLGLIKLAHADLTT